MRAVFINIILLSAIFFACEKPQASWSIDDSENPSLSHGQLSCLECHPDINESLNHNNSAEFENFSAFPHADVSCLECHKDAAMLDHDNQGKTDCIDCHIRHHEKVTHDVHIDIHRYPLRVMPFT